MRRVVCAAALVVGLGILGGCHTGPSNADGGSSGDGGGPSSDGGGADAGGSLLAGLQSETNGAIAAQAYQEHQPTSTEAAELAGFLGYVIQAKQTGGFDPGFLGSNLVAEVQQIATEYPAFFTVEPDGGLVPKGHFVNGPQDFSCSASCEPGAGALSSSFLNTLPSGLQMAASAYATTIGAAAQTLEQSGTPIGQAFDQALANSDTSTVQNVINLFDAAFTQSGDIAAAATALGLSTTETQEISDAIGEVLGLGLESDVVTALQNADQLMLQCQAWKSANCAQSASASSAGFSGGSTGSVSGAGSSGSTAGSTGSGSSSGATGASGSTGTTGSPATAGSTAGSASSAGPSSTGTTASTVGRSSRASASAGGPTRTLTSSAGPTSSTGSSGTTGTSGSTGTAPSRTSFTGSAVDFNNSIAPPQVVADHQGNLLAIWEQTEPGNEQCDIMGVSFFSVSTETWSAAQVVPIAAPDAGTGGYLCRGFSSANAALADNGDALVAWPYSTITDTEYAVHYDHATRSWTGPTQIAPQGLLLGPGQGGISPSVALNSAGEGWVLFPGEPYACESERVMGVSFSPDAGFSTPLVVDADPNGIASSSSPPSCQCTAQNPGTTTTEDSTITGIVSLTDDTFVAAWGRVVSVDSNSCQSVSPTDNSIMMGARASATTWGTPFGYTVPDLPQPNNFNAPRLRALAAGGTSVAAVWQGLDVDGGVADALYTVAVTGLSSSDSTWELPQALPDQNNGDPIFISLQLRSGGDGMVVWDGTGATNDEYAAPINSALQVGAAQDLTTGCPFQTSGTNISFYGTVAVGPNGGAAATWEFLGTLLGSRYEPDAGWSTCTAIATSDAGALEAPQVIPTGNDFATVYGTYFVPMATNQLYYQPGMP